MYDRASRRSFLKTAAMGAAAVGWFAKASVTAAETPDILGFEEVEADSQTSKNWKPVLQPQDTHGNCRLRAV